MPKFSFSKSGSSSGGSSSGGRTANVKTPSLSFDSGTKLNPISSSEAASMLNSSGGKLGLDISGLGSSPKYKPSSTQEPALTNSGGGGGGISQRKAMLKAQEEARRQREFLKDLQQRKNRNEQLSLDKRIKANQGIRGKPVSIGSSMGIDPAIAAHREHERKIELIKAQQLGELANAEAMKVAGAFQALGGML